MTLYACYVFSARPEKQKFHEGFFADSNKRDIFASELIFWQTVNGGLIITKFMILMPFQRAFCFTVKIKSVSFNPEIILPANSQPFAKHT